MNIVNNKRYIGQSVNVEDRLLHHRSELRNQRHSNSHLQRSWNKYGEDNFKFEILFECQECELDYLERYYISFYNTIDREYGYNKESGGSLNKHMSEESKRKMSVAKQGMYDGENNPMYNVHIPWTEDRKQKMSEKFRGENNPMYGVHLRISEEQKSYMSSIFSGENNPFYGKKHDEETIAKMRKNNKHKKPVRCIETNEVYESSGEASRQTGIYVDSIIKCCNGKQKTAGNMHWEHVTQ